MIGKQYFISRVSVAQSDLNNLNPESFDDDLDMSYKKASLQSMVDSYQNSMVEFNKNANASSEEEASMLIHETCVKNMKEAREKLKEAEAKDNNTVESNSEIGKWNGIIDAYAEMSIFFSNITSDFAAMHERKQNG